MLVKMVDGGIVNYTDDCECYAGCPTCDYGSEYINEIDIELTKHTVHIKLNQMYDYLLSEGQMMKLFLTNYNAMQVMTESDFIDWLKCELTKIVGSDELSVLRGACLEEFIVKEI